MHVTDEQRDAWVRTTRHRAFRRSLGSETTRSDGTLDLAALRRIADDYGVEWRAYAHLNPGQQRMNIGNRLRTIVPATVYGQEGRHPGRVMSFIPAPDLAGSEQRVWLDLMNNKPSKLLNFKLRSPRS